VKGASTPTITPEMAAIAAHGIGRGDFAAIVFSGPADVLGEVSGYGTWLASRKFAIPDPRLPAEQDLARQPGWPLSEWPAERVRPTPGVCFVFADDGHPAVDAIRARGGIEYEHFVVLTRLTLAALMRRRIDRFLDVAGPRQIVVLGYGDQGGRVVRELLDRGIPSQRLSIADDRPERQIAAANAGLRVVTLSDPQVPESAIISSPLARPAAFTQLVRDALRAGGPVLDNSLPWDGHAEFSTTEHVSRTGCAARSTILEGRRLIAADHGLALPLCITQSCGLRVGERPVPALRSGFRATIATGNESGGLDLSRPHATDQLAHLIANVRHAFVHLEGQSNHQDAAFSILAARAFLMEFYPEAISEILPAEHRSQLGSTPFERTVTRTTTGRSLGSPYMTPCEQVAIGVLARQFCGSGFDGAPIIEIGSAIGGSTLLMAAATEGERPSDGPPIFSIDPDAATRPAMRALFEHAGYAPRLTQIVTTSDAAIDRLGHLAGRVGMVFIDGLHTRACSAADFAAYAPLLRPGGCIAFHDCDVRHAGVFRTVNQIAASDARFTVRCLVDTIAVFERTGS
jgi:predicted O-methyltransferase YrrM